MGILDDAIREHLELKRSHGASDDEIQRQEVEAFGAARREAEAAALAEAESVAPDEPELAAPVDAEPEAHVAPEPALQPEPEAATPELADLEPLEPLEPAPEDPYEVHPGDSLVPDPDVPPPVTHHDHHDEQHPALVDHDHIGGEEHPPEPVFGHGTPEPTVEEPPVEEPLVEEPPAIEDLPTEPHQIAEAGEEDEDEDVLEETPEFLQDAPEHDRLWFEQRPPRDFDFGE